MAKINHKLSLIFSEYDPEPYPYNGQFSIRDTNFKDL